MAFTSRREGRLWLTAGLLQLAIYLSSAYVRVPVNWLRERGLLGWTVGLVFLIAVTSTVAKTAQRRPGAREISAVIGFALVLAFVLSRVHMVEERVHFLEYGLIGFLIYEALSERRANRIAEGVPVFPAWVPALAAIGLTALSGWGDEGIQALLPDRVYDLRDVAMNVTGGLLAVSAAAAAKWARMRDRAGGSRPGAEPRGS